MCLFGTEKKFQIQDFDNMSLILPLDISEGKSILKIDRYLNDLKELENDVGQLQSSSPRKFAIHEALWQCQALFNDIKGKVDTKKILLFTTNDDPHASDQVLKRQALKKANDLKGID